MPGSKKNWKSSRGVLEGSEEIDFFSNKCGICTLFFSSQERGTEVKKEDGGRSPSPELVHLNRIEEGVSFKKSSSGESDGEEIKELQNRIKQLEGRTSFLFTKNKRLVPLKHLL